MVDTHRLVLVRHAKASGSSTGGDRSRRLTERGRSDAGRAGAWLAARVDRVDAVWSSSATRARETARELLAHLDPAPDPEWRDDLYDAGVGDLLEAVHQAGDPIGVLVVVGHNPTIEAAYATFTGDQRGFRPGAAAILELDGPWAGAVSGAARPVDLWSP